MCFPLNVYVCRERIISLLVSDTRQGWHGSSNAHREPRHARCLLQYNIALKWGEKTEPRLQITGRKRHLRRKIKTNNQSNNHNTSQEPKSYQNTGYSFGWRNSEMKVIGECGSCEFLKFRNFGFPLNRFNFHSLLWRLLGGQVISQHPTGQVSNHGRAGNGEVQGDGELQTPISVPFIMIISLAMIILHDTVSYIFPSSPLLFS